jgi:hypothetical protein
MPENRPKTTLLGLVELAVIGLLAALIILLAIPVMHDLVPSAQQNLPPPPTDSTK